MVASGLRTMIALVPYPAISLVSINPSILQVLTIIRPETLVRWHRAGFRCYWRWHSRPLGGRLQIETELRVLIRRMSVENPLWGALRIHGELLKLGIAVAQSSVAKYMVNGVGRQARDGAPFCVVMRRPLLSNHIDRWVL
jgi:hypothetical protein